MSRSVTILNEGINSTRKDEILSDIKRKINRTNALLLVTSLCLAVLFFACDDLFDNDAPVLVSLNAPDFIPIGFTETIYFRLTVDDNQGIDDVDTAYFVIINPDSTLRPDTLYMYDNGEDGDITSGDGVYTYAITLDNTPQTKGEYTYRFTAKDSEGELSENLDKVIEIDVHPKPYLFNLNPPDSILVRNTDSNLFTLQVNDPQGLSDVDIVYFTIEDVEGIVSVDTSFMHDDGSDGDVTADDGIYSFILDDYGFITVGGDYIFRFNAIDLSDNISNQLVDTISTGDNPYLYDLVAPDSLEKGSPFPAYLFVKVWDPQGPANIDSVYFTVMRPDSSSSGAIIEMFDDGDLENHGDSTYGDNIYSRGIQPPGGQSYLGYYTFYFIAVDFEGNQADTVSKQILVYSPVLTSSSDFGEYNSNLEIPDIWK